MVNVRFYKNLGPHKLSSIINFLGDAIKDPKAHYEDIDIYEIKPIEEASNNHIGFIHNPKYHSYLKNTAAAAVIVPIDTPKMDDNDVSLLYASNPYFAYSKLTNFFYSDGKPYPPQIMKSAHVADSASVGQNCYIGHNVVVEEDAIIGDNSIIESSSIIGRGVIIGKNALIYSNVSINYSIIGDDVVILSGARLGQDGFGFSTEKGVHYKIFHTGIVKIGNNVEIGANTTIDRGAISDTIIEDLCRIDNLVQIGHSVRIQKGSIIVAQVGIAGSTNIGKYCAIAGQVGIAGHLTIGDNVQIAGQSGIIRDIKPGEKVAGTPAVPSNDWHRQTIIMKQLLKRSE